MLVTEAWVALAALALITIGGVVLARRVIVQAQAYKKDKLSANKRTPTLADLSSLRSRSANLNQIDEELKTTSPEYEVQLSLAESLEEFNIQLEAFAIEQIVELKKHSASPSSESIEELFRSWVELKPDFVRSGVLTKILEQEFPNSIDEIRSVEARVLDTLTIDVKTKPVRRKQKTTRSPA